MLLVYSSRCLLFCKGEGKELNCHNFQTTRLTNTLLLQSSRRVLHELWSLVHGGLWKKCSPLEREPLPVCSPNKWEKTESAILVAEEEIQRALYSRIKIAPE